MNCGSGYGQNVIEFNKTVESWAKLEYIADFPVTFVDCCLGFDVRADTQDGVHSNSGSGVKKMANSFYEPLLAVIRAKKEQRRQVGELE
jgi:hypothetical protein